MFCCSVGVKSLNISEVGKRDSSDREDYYFDCQEPSSDAEKCVCICESATLESTRFYLPLFRFPPALVLLLATLVTIMGRESGIGQHHSGDCGRGGRKSSTGASTCYRSKHEWPRRACSILV